MGTIWIREFKGGLDVRRPPEVSPGGTLMRARNCHLTRGGDIEQRADFVSAYSLPASLTKGLAATPSGLVVFGHQASVAGLPAGVTYQQLAHPSGEALADVPVATLYKSKIAAIGEFADGSRYLFYDGSRITDANAPPMVDGSSPKALLTDVEKLFAASGETLFFSAVGDATDFGAGAGAGDGFITMSTHANGAEDLTGLGRYDEYMAVFAKRVIQIWFQDPDPANSVQAQTLANTGALGPRSVTQFGDGDLFYLDLTGIRSLRARDSSNSAATTDIGSPVDPLVVERINALGQTEAAKAIGLIAPQDGRFWLAMGDRIFVFSFFAANKISAWSEYYPGFDVEHMLEWDDRVWIRSGDTIYVYGGLPGADFQYSENVVADVWTPYLDADAPTRRKHVTAVDAAVRGTWSIALACDPTNESVEDMVAVIDKTTFGLNDIPGVGGGTHMSLRFRSSAPVNSTTPAKLCSAVVHFFRDDEEDS